jgi:hypothetical protein
MTSKEERRSEYGRVAALLPQAKEQLMRYPGVRDVAVGVKEKSDRTTEVIGFRVYVDKKRAPDEMPDDAIIPKEVLGVPTDVIEEPVIQNEVDDDKYRPLAGGIQIGNDSSSALGTLGCIAQLDSDHSIVVLSNQHVMLYGGASNGEKIGQPEIACCCCCKMNVIGEVVNAVNNTSVDCAIARVTGQPGFTNEILDIGPIFGSAAIVPATGSTVGPSERVRKRGRTTGVTTGTVVTPLYTTPAGSDAPSRTNQLEIKPDPGFTRFSDHGDSGSVIVDENNVVVALLWGGDHSKPNGNSYGTRITDVVAALHITIINSGTADTIPLGAAPSAEEVEALDVPTPPFRDMADRLAQSPRGRLVLELFERHWREINALLESNRDVKVAWHRFQGPAFTAHLIESARDRDHVIPAEIQGVALGNLLIRMSVVLQEHGSTALAAMVEANTLPLLELFASGNRVDDLLDRFTIDDAQNESTGTPVVTSA